MCASTRLISTDADRLMSTVPRTALPSRREMQIRNGTPVRPVSRSRDPAPALTKRPGIELRESQDSDPRFALFRNLDAVRKEYRPAVAAGHSPAEIWLAIGDSAVSAGEE